MRTSPNAVVIPGRTRIRLAPGSHSSPREGVCVVELAALIAQEEFSDRPRCVCPVIGAFLRGFNDRASHAERQRLIPYATRIVDSRGDERLTRERRDICLNWAGAALSHGRLRRVWARIGMRLRIALFCGLGAAWRLNEGSGDYAARVAMSRGDTEWAIELLETLLAAGDERGSAKPSLPAGNGRVRVNGRGLPPPTDAPVAENGHGSTNGHGPATNGDGAANGKGSTAKGASRTTVR